MITKTLRITLGLGALTLVVACGGTTVPLPTGNSRLSLAEIEQVAGRIKPAYDSVNVTPKALVPTSGSAAYDGYVAGNLTVPGNRTDVAGLMQMGIDFGRNQVGGTVGNFVTSGGAPLDGVLTLRNGVLNRGLNPNQVTIQSDVGGTLRSGGGETIAVDGRIARGGFKGTGAQYIGVPITGNIAVSGNGGVQNGTVTLNGALAER